MTQRKLLASRLVALEGATLKAKAQFIGAAFIAAGSAAAGEGLSTYGTPGMIDMPSALTSPDGTLSLTTSHLTGHTRNSLQFQISPRLSGVFRYSILRDYFSLSGGGDLYDRSFDLHYQFRQESPNFPALAIGLRDFGGTGIFASEYIVATKHLGQRFDVSGGIGWGRLGSYGGFSNPFGADSRPGFSGIEETGRVALDRFFKGDAALFAGVAYQYNDRLRLVGEYSSDAYNAETSRMGFERKSPVNVGVNYSATKNLTLNAFVIGGAQAGFGVTYVIDPRKPAFPGGIERNIQPIKPRAALDWADEDIDTTRARLKNALQAQGILLEAFQHSGETVRVVLVNARYAGSAQALGRSARAMANSLPASVEKFEITLSSDGVPTSKTTLRRADLEELEHAWDGSWQSFVRAKIEDAPSRLPADPGIYPKLDWSLLPYYSLSFFDPDSPIRGDLGVSAKLKYAIAPGLSITAVIRQKALGTLNQSNRVSDSGLPHVRSDHGLYDKSTGPKVPILTGDYLFRPGANLYGRLSAGYFEQMFAGISSELLWFPTNSRLALGAEINYVGQRDPNSVFGLNDYRVATGHVSAYYDFGNTYYAQFDVGRYLAGDLGATLTLDRKFDNGFTVGAFATLTDVSFEDFGEGSFDKGIHFTIPLNWITGQPSRTGFSQTIRPIQRDGGARLSVANRLYDQVKHDNANEMEHNWGKFWR